MNLTDANFQPAPCMPCGSEPPTPTECSCALLIPPEAGSGTYADYATAEAAIADVASCITFGKEAFDLAWTSFTASLASSTTVDVDVAFNAEDQAFFTAYLCITVPEGTDLTLNYTLTQMTVEEPPPPDVTSTLIVYSCDNWTQLDDDTQTGSTSGSLSVTGLDAGTYYIGLNSDYSVDSSFQLVASTDIVVNPVIALWDDSVTTRQLEACPKLYLPYQTEISGTWYADEAAAQDVLDDPLTVSDCIGFFFPTVDWTSASAADSGTAVTLSASFSPDQGDMAGIVSINAEAGETITFTASGFADLNVIIYDTEFNIVESLVGSSPQTSATLPYTGRYIIDYQLSNGTVPSGSIVITSSGSLSANPIQALYDVGLTCPARLDC